VDIRTTTAIRREAAYVTPKALDGKWLDDKWIEAAPEVRPGTFDQYHFFKPQSLLERPLTGKARNARSWPTAALTDVCNSAAEIVRPVSGFVNRRVRGRCRPTAGISGRGKRQQIVGIADIPRSPRFRTPRTQMRPHTRRTTVFDYRHIETRKT
jgi:hypothetical protein